MRETEIASKIYTELKQKHNCFVFNIAGSVFQKNGMPDSLIIKDNHYIWIEFKVEDSSLKANQLGVIRELSKQNVHVFVVRFIDPNYWLIDEFYQLRFRLFKDGVKDLWNLLQTLETSRKGANVSSITPST